MKTKRIKIRRFKLKDLNDFHEYAQVEGVGEMAGWTHHKTINQTKAILERFVVDEEVFAIVYNKKVIGSVSLHKSWANEVYPHLDIKEIGYVISKDYWGQAFAIEATNLLLDFGFNKLNLDAITICHFVDNIQSKKVIEKTNFKYVKDDLFQNKLESQYILYNEDYVNNFFSNDFNYIKSDDISLRLIKTFYTDKISLSFYYYNIILNETNEVIGKISIRIGHNYHSYYNGNIGYEIDEKYRGNNYSYLSSKLVLKVAKFHKMKYIYLTTTPSNIASNKIIRKLNAKLIEEVVVPSEYFNYYEGIENHNIYKLKI